MIEIVLAIVAWRKGWKGYALIPVACSLLAGLTLGSMGASFGTLLMAEAVVVTVLGFMIARPPQAKQQLAASR
jgi:hypothetical protein